MSELLQLTAGSEVRCTDGRVGHVGGLVFDPQTGTVTHLSVATHSPGQMGRLVPLQAVQSAGPAVQLACDKHDYHAFVNNEKFVSAVGAGQSSAVLHVHLVPHGETELTEDETVHAADGRAGHLVGAVVDRDGFAVHKLLVRVGLLSRRHQVSVPFDSVTHVDEHGVHLRMSKDELSAG